jgi:hypothetical protein
METLIDDNKLKNLLKGAVSEVFEEKRDMFYDLFTEVIEDIGLINAIKEGENTKSVSRKDIFKILEGKK